MKLSRRNFFGLGALATAAGLVPAAELMANSSEPAIGPILLERVCDGGRSEMAAEDIKKWEMDLQELHGDVLKHHPHFPGCGTKFQWYFGSYGCCPNCGRAYLMTLEMLKSNKYNVRA